MKVFDFYGHGATNNSALAFLKLRALKKWQLKNKKEKENHTP